ncbi:MAG: hypothetical protein AAGK21_08110 [Bacteroidota bacterium]
MRPIAFFALLALAASGCVTTAAPPDAPTPRPTVEDRPPVSPLVGRWDMERVLDDGSDVTDQHDPNNDRFIVLFDDGTFESGGGPYGRNTGRWIYNTNTRRLGLDSDLGPEDDSIWTVTLRGDTMEWSGEGSAFARRFRITSRRAR